MAALQEDFARRLHEALDLAGMPKGRSRTGALAERYAVTRETARKWLTGMTFPEMEKLISFARDFGVSFEWLATGRGAKLLPFEPQGESLKLGGSSASRIADISPSHARALEAVAALTPDQQEALVRLLGR